MNFQRIVVNYLPSSLRLRIHSLRVRWSRKDAISQWIQLGKPIPPPHAVKQIVIEDYKQRFRYNVFVETGTYKGHMVYAQLANFKAIYSIELDRSYYEKAKDLFRHDKHVKLVNGDSSKSLIEVTKSLNEPAIFWLDGHYMGNNGVMGETECPIWGELNAIFSGVSLPHVIIIDDARSFTGVSDYPSIESITKWIKNRDPRYQVIVDSDIIQYFIP